MTKRKPARVLNYSPEFGYIVAGTHDVVLATEMLEAHLATEGDEPLASQRLSAPRQVWGRCAQVSWMMRDEYKWMWQRTEPGARGATPAVEWSR